MGELFLECFLLKMKYNFDLQNQYYGFNYIFSKSCVKILVYSFSSK